MVDNDMEVCKIRRRTREFSASASCASRRLAWMALMVLKPMISRRVLGRKVLMITCEYNLSWEEDGMWRLGVAEYYESVESWPWWEYATNAMLPLLLGILGTRWGGVKIEKELPLNSSPTNQVLPNKTGAQKILGKSSAPFFLLTKIAFLILARRTSPGFSVRLSYISWKLATCCLTSPAHLT